MQKEKEQKEFDNSGKKPALIWYSLAVILVISFSILPAPDYSNPWDSSIKLIDSATSIPNEGLRTEMIKVGGKELLALIDKYPYHAKLHTLVGYYFFMNGEMDSVIRHQTKALELVSGGGDNSIEKPARDLLTNATINKGLYYLALGDTVSAFKLYASSVRLAPDQLLINRNLAGFYLNRNKTDAALFHYYAALRIDNQDIESMLGLGRCYYYKGIPDSVSHYANMILTQNPSNTDAQNLLDLIKK